jgi:hypothetical protein
MIGGSGNRLAKIARTKSSPDIDAITSTGMTPYLIVCSPDLSMIARPFCLEATRQIVILPLLTTRTAWSRPPARFLGVHQRHRKRCNPLQAQSGASISTRRPKGG